MAHVTKFSRAASGHMFKHFERARDENGDYIKFSNQSIDPARTSENYSLAPVRNISQGDYIRLRCTDPGVIENKRKDLNVMCSWVVTLPQELPVSDHRQFFEESYIFMANRYGGEQNVVSAYVHMDEVRPHMHFAFVPIVENKQKGGYKVSAKDAVNRHDLQTFHADLDHYMEQVYDRNIGILNEATKEGNKSIEELKRGDAARQVAELRQQALGAQERAQDAQKALQEVEKAKDTTQDDLTRLRRDTEQAQQGLREVQKAAARMSDTANRYAEQKKVTADREAAKTVKDAQRDAADLRGQAEKEARQTVAQARGEAEAIRQEIPALQEQRDAAAKELAEVRAEAKYTEVQPVREKRGVFDKELKEVSLTAEDDRKYNAAIQRGFDLERDLRLAHYDIGEAKYQKREIRELQKENKDLRHEVGELKEAITNRDTYIDHIHKFFDENPGIGNKAMEFVDRLKEEAEKVREAAEKAVEKVRERVRDIFPDR